jgi:ubiquinone/menaquinone biosynthesis C-methylase UbiE
MAIWDDIADREELDLDDEHVNRQLRWREIERALVGARTVLDVGAGTGAFSIPLAQRGYAVTHLDVSPAMLAIARSNTGAISNISFVEADARDLSQFDDGAFDLVLNLDGAVSFAGGDAERVIAETCRVARRRVVVTASNKGCMTATWLNYSLAASGTVMPAVTEMLAHGRWERDPLEPNDAIANRFPFEAFRAFTPAELRAAIEATGLAVTSSRGIGSLTHLYLLHLYRQQPAESHAARIPRDEAFVDLCDQFDREVMPDGPGSFRRAGVIAIAERNAPAS